MMSSTDKAYLTFLMQHYIAASMSGAFNSGSGTAESGLYGNVILGRPAGSGEGDVYNMMSVLDKVTNYTSQLLINENIDNPYAYFRGRISGAWQRILSENDLVTKLSVAENASDYPNWDNELRIYRVKQWAAASADLPNHDWSSTGDYMVVNIPGAPNATTLHALTQFVVNNSTMEIWCRFVPAYSGSGSLANGNPSEWIQLSGGIGSALDTLKNWYGNRQITVNWLFDTFSYTAQTKTLTLHFSGQTVQTDTPICTIYVVNGNSQRFSQKTITVNAYHFFGERSYAHTSTVDQSDLIIKFTGEATGELYYNFNMDATTSGQADSNSPTIFNITDGKPFFWGFGHIHANQSELEARVYAVLAPEVTRKISDGLYEAQFPSSDSALFFLYDTKGFSRTVKLNEFTALSPETIVFSYGDKTLQVRLSSSADTFAAYNISTDKLELVSTSQMDAASAKDRVLLYYFNFMSSRSGFLTDVERFSGGSTFDPSELEKKITTAQNTAEAAQKDFAFTRKVKILRNKEYEITHSGNKLTFTKSGGSAYARIAEVWKCTSNFPATQPANLTVTTNTIDKYFDGNVTSASTQTPLEWTLKSGYDGKTIYFVVEAFVGFDFAIYDDSTISAISNPDEAELLLMLKIDLSGNIDEVYEAIHS